MAGNRRMRLLVFFLLQARAGGHVPPGVYQVIAHLAYDDEEMRGATYDHPDWGAAWRQHDLDMVKSAEFRQFLKEQGLILVTWKELAKVRQK